MKNPAFAFVADLYRRFGEGLGLLEGPAGKDDGRTAQEINEALGAKRRMRERVERLKLAALSDDELVALCHRGRRQIWPGLSRIVRR